MVRHVCSSLRERAKYSQQITGRLKVLHENLYVLCFQAFKLCPSQNLEHGYLTVKQGYKSLKNTQFTTLTKLIPSIKPCLKKWSHLKKVKSRFKETSITQRCFAVALSEILKMLTAGRRVEIYGILLPHRRHNIITSTLYKNQTCEIFDTSGELSGQRKE